MSFDVEKVKFLMSLGATQAMNYKEVDFAHEVSKKIDSSSRFVISRQNTQIGLLLIDIKIFQIDSVTNGLGVDFILDLVGQSYWNSNIKSLSKDGKLVLLGLLSGGKIQTPVELGPILFKRLKIEGMCSKDRMVFFVSYDLNLIKSLLRWMMIGTTLRSRSIDYQHKLLKEFSEVYLSALIGTSDVKKTLKVVIHKVSIFKQRVEKESCMDLFTDFILGCFTLIYLQAYPWEEIVKATKEMEESKNIGKIICRI